jgi:hypothetical protein
MKSHGRAKRCAIFSIGQSNGSGTLALADQRSTFPKLNRIEPPPQSRGVRLDTEIDQGFPIIRRRKTLGAQGFARLAFGAGLYSHDQRWVWTIPWEYLNFRLLSFVFFPGRMSGVLAFDFRGSELDD